MKSVFWKCDQMDFDSNVFIERTKKDCNYYEKGFCTVNSKRCSLKRYIIKEWHIKTGLLTDIEEK